MYAITTRHPAILLLLKAAYIPAKSAGTYAPRAQPKCATAILAVPFHGRDARGTPPAERCSALHMAGKFLLKKEFTALQCIGFLLRLGRPGCRGTACRTLFIFIAGDALVPHFGMYALTAFGPRVYAEAPGHLTTLKGGNVIGISRRRAAEEGKYAHL